jgi:hypothetical protein
VVQAAGWLAAMRDDLRGLADLNMEGRGIDALAQAETPAPESTRELARLRGALARKAQRTTSTNSRRPWQRRAGESTALGRPHRRHGRGLSRQPQGLRDRAVPPRHAPLRDAGRPCEGRHSLASRLVIRIPRQ